MRKCWYFTMTTGNTRNYFCIIGVGVEDIDFANFILLVEWLGVMEIGISVLWFVLFDMFVLFVEYIRLLPLESELKILVCRNVLSKLDSFFVICSVGAGFRNVFVCFFIGRKHFFWNEIDRKIVIVYFVVMIIPEQYKHEIFLEE